MNLPASAILIRRLDGIDCSHYQIDAGPIDLRVTRSIPLNWIAWKCTQSTSYVDPTFAWARSVTRNIGFEQRLFYHWLSSITDPIMQAEHYLEAMNVVQLGEGVMLDAEENGITVEKCLAWMEHVENVTRRPCAIYFGIYVAGSTIARDPRIRTSRFGPRMMHVAAYVTISNLVSRLTTLGLLDMPIDAWQWSSGGSVPGITGRCDVDAVFNETGYDSVCGIRPEPDHEEVEMTLPIVTNSEQFYDSAPNVAKFVVMDDGTLRHLGGSEYRARVLASGLPESDPINQGDPWSNGEIGAAGSYTPPVTVVPDPTPNIIVAINGALIDFENRIDAIITDALADINITVNGSFGGTGTTDGGTQ